MNNKLFYILLIDGGGIRGVLRMTRVVCLILEICFGSMKIGKKYERVFEKIKHLFILKAKIEIVNE